jgi:hypothetical protein
LYRYTSNKAGGENKMKITRERMTVDDVLDFVKTDNRIKNMQLDKIESSVKRLREDTNAGLEEILHVIESNLQDIEEITKNK